MKAVICLVTVCLAPIVGAAIRTQGRFKGNVEFKKMDQFDPSSEEYNAESNGRAFQNMDALKQEGFGVEDGNLGEDFPAMQEQDYVPEPVALPYESNDRAFQNMDVLKQEGFSVEEGNLGADENSDMNNQYDWQERGFVHGDEHYDPPSDGFETARRAHNDRI